MTVQTVLDWLDSFAPFDSAADFDNVGLLVGDAAANVTGVLFCMDATADAVAEAVQNGCNLIVSHHPLLYHGMKRIYYEDPKGSVLHAVMAANANLVAAHTNLDQAPGGIADSLAAALGLQSVGPTEGPYIRVGTLETPLSLADLADRARQVLHITPRAYGQPDQPIRRVAVGPGACGELYEIALRSGAQAFVTGEIRHHEIIDATQRGMAVVEAGHYPTEQPGVVALYQRFLSELAAREPSARAVLCSTPPYPGASNA